MSGATTMFFACQPHEPEWDSWAKGESRCPICEGLPEPDFRAICDCWQWERENPQPPERPPP